MSKNDFITDVRKAVEEAVEPLRRHASTQGNTVFNTVADCIVAAVTEVAARVFVEGGHPDNKHWLDERKKGSSK